MSIAGKAMLEERNARVRESPTVHRRGCECQIPMHRLCFGAEKAQNLHRQRNLGPVPGLPDTMVQYHFSGWPGSRPVSRPDISISAQFDLKSVAAILLRCGTKSSHSPV